MNFFLDLLFPKRCVSCKKLGAYICKDCFSKIEFLEHPVCPVCQRQAFEGKTHPGCRGRYRPDGLVVACKYSGPVRAAIIKVKYKWIYDIEKVLVDLIVDVLWKFDLPKDIILIPVPLHSSRKKWRGFNQSEVLARTLAERFKAPFSDCMDRIRETKSQVGFKRDARKENVKDAFALRFAQGKPFQASGRNFILVDDVYTSGATMAECCRILKKAGAKSVWGIAVALG